MQGQKILTCLFIALLLSSNPLRSQTRTTGAGSRSIPVHRIPLQVIDPLDEEEVFAVTPEDEETLLPFSTRKTCSECHVCRHDYDTISQGWHFNALDPNVSIGRPGEPWILSDAALAVQIPLSYRKWPGTYRPEQLGLSTFQFTQHFGQHLPGGGPGEVESSDKGDILRQMISGKLEINCLLCHNAHPGQDPAEVAHQVEQHNFRWAAAAGCEFTHMEGAAKDMPDTFDPSMPDLLEDSTKIPPTLTYKAEVFNEKDEVLFDIVREVPDERCYFCHSQINLDKEGGEKWQADEDVHLQAGMTCVDCHREGLSHQTIRGYEGEVTDNPLAAQSTCRGCHLGTESESPQAGRLGAPVPLHKGIPTIHFEKLTCTACHSGPWPEDNTERVQTSRSHHLGTHGPVAAATALPHISVPVFAPEADGKLAPHKLLWPAFWGAMDANNTDTVTPLPLKTVTKAVGPILATLTPSAPGNWPDLEPNHVTTALKALGEAGIEAPVYIAGGQIHLLGDAEALETNTKHSAAQPYLWPLAHNVRPAAQSLGVRSCQDCHNNQAPFLNATVKVDSPMVAHREATQSMLSFQGLDPQLARWFASSFVFRPWMKIVGLAACTLIALVLLVYGLRALNRITQVNE